MPLRVDGRIVGSLALGVSRSTRTWLGAPLDRLRLVAEVFVNALSRREAQQARDRAETALRAHHEQLEGVVAERTAALSHANSAFAHSISHDLKAPLRSLRGFSDALVEEYSPRLDGDARRYLGFIGDGADRMTALINDMLQHARLGQGDRPREQVDLDDLVARVTDTLRASITAAAGPVRAEPGLPAVWGHRRTLELMLQNLVENALKFRHPGRRPDVRVEGHLEPDTGIGIASAYHARIFEMFECLHSPDEYEGTGIGLALVKRAVALHRGVVSVESVVGEGSVFSIVLPRRLQDRHPAPPD